MRGIEGEEGGPRDISLYFINYSLVFTLSFDWSSEAGRNVGSGG